MENSYAAGLDYANPAIQNLIEESHRLRQEVHHLTHANKNLLEDNTYLEEALRRALRKRFAPSSEASHHPDQKSLFNEAELEAARDEDEDSQTELAKPYRKKKKNRGTPTRNPLPKDLPRQVRVIDLPEDEKVCPHSGAPLTPMGMEVSEQLDIEPAKMVVVETQRLKYVCHCPLCVAKSDAPPSSAGEERTALVKVAPNPPAAIPKSMAGPGLLAMIAVNKFELALPLYRQAAMFKRSLIELKRASMGSWMIRCGQLITPLINLMWEELLKKELLYADETPLQVHKGTGKKPTAKSYMWAFMGGRHAAGPPIALYELGPGRSHLVALRYLETYEGYLHTDGYEAYQTLVGKCPKIVLVGDWVHVRRRFDEAIKAQPDPASPNIKARVAFDLINELFAIERELADLSADERLAARQLRSQKIVDQLKAWAEREVSEVAPKTLTGVAIRYLLNQWDKLMHFLNDGRVGLDTNPIENKIRPFVIGRRNWLFSDSVAGAESSAALYSLIVTAKANGHDAFKYLRHVFTELPKAQTADEVAALLPWNVAPLAS